MYKVVLVGLGGISNTHLPVWKELDDCELVAVCDTRPEQMDAYPDARHYTDFYEMLEKEKLAITITLLIQFGRMCLKIIVSVRMCRFYLNKAAQVRPVLSLVPPLKEQKTDESLQISCERQKRT